MNYITVMATEKAQLSIINTINILANDADIKTAKLEQNEKVCIIYSFRTRGQFRIDVEVTYSADGGGRVAIFVNDLEAMYSYLNSDNLARVELPLHKLMMKSVERGQELLEEALSSANTRA